MLTARGKRAEPLHGVPWRDLTDDYFDTAARLMDERFPGDPGSLARSGFFEHVPERPPKAQPQED
jgi:hypothetical protein